MSTIPEATQMGNASSTAFGQQKTGLGSTMAPDHGVGSHQCGEGPLARVIEEQTARIPSDTWLWAAGFSVALSLAYQARGENHKALFVGQWAQTLLLLGVYNKIVKLHGSE